MRLDQLLVICPHDLQGNHLVEGDLLDEIKQIDMFTSFLRVFRSAS